MDFSKIVPTLAAVAPSIAGLLGGPLASMGVQTLEGFFGLTPPADDKTRAQQLVQAVQGMTPEQAVQLAQIDADLKKKMIDAGIDLEKIAAGDRDSARKMQAETKDWTPRVLAVLLTSGFFAVLAYMIRFGIPAGAGNEALLIMVGNLGAAFTAVISFFYGSSAGSAKKDDTIKVAMSK
jgi:hypothetical protein